MISRYVAVALMLTLAGRAAADTPTADAVAAAEAHHRRGSMLFDLGDYAAAITEFQAGFVLTNAPGFLYNLGQAYRLAGDCERAERAYRAYLDAAPVANRSLIESRIDEMAACRARHAEPVPAPPPPPFAAASQPAAPAKRSELLRPIGWGTLVLGTVAAGVATWATLETRAATQHVEDVAARGGTWTPQDQAIEDHGKRMRSVAVVGWSAAAIAIVGGGALVYLGRDRREGPTVQAAVTPHGGDVALTWGF
jgi:tetratricopeptide (TPR) repeat protein